MENKKEIKKTSPKKSLASTEKSKSVATKVCRGCCNAVDKGCKGVAKAAKAVDKPFNTKSKRESISQRVGYGTGKVVDRLNKMNTDFHELEEDCINKLKEFRKK